MGPQSQDRDYTGPKKVGDQHFTGKTARDKATGKHARRLTNRRSDTLRNSGGKQFGAKK